MDIALLVAVGVLAGALSALLGIGGGLLLVPFMVLVLGFDQHLAQGTSLAVIVPTAIVGAVAHHRRGFVDLKLAGMMLVGGLVGVYAGSQLALAVSGRALRIAFGVVMIALGLRLVVLGARKPGPEQGSHDPIV